MSDTEPIRGVDLFAGAGGLSWGLVEALREVAIDADAPTREVLEQLIDLVAVNHWETAIETHERNHPWARHFHDDVQNVNPRAVFDDPDAEVTVLTGGIECVHWSSARGGKPVNEQKRMPAWDVLDWVQKLRPKNVLLENVPEFCFPAGTMVLTKEGPRPIQGIEVGDEVLTHKAVHIIHRLNTLRRVYLELCSAMVVDRGANASVVADLAGYHPF